MASLAGPRPDRHTTATTLTVALPTVCLCQCHARSRARTGILAASTSVCTLLVCPVDPALLDGALVLFLDLGHRLDALASPFGGAWKGAVGRARSSSSALLTTVLGRHAHRPARLPNPGPCAPPACAFCFFLAVFASSSSRRMASMMSSPPGAMGSAKEHLGCSQSAGISACTRPAGVATRSGTAMAPVFAKCARSLDPRSGSLAIAQRCEAMHAVDGVAGYAGNGPARSIVFGSRARASSPISTAHWGIARISAVSIQGHHP